jgi:hypothetical protein
MEFTAIPEDDVYIITAHAGQDGTISPEGEVGVIHGQNKIFTITPNAGSRITDVIVDNVSVGAVTTYEFTNVVENHTIRAEFVKTWTVVFKYWDGTVLSTQVIDHGKAAVVPSVSAGEGYSFTGWSATPEDADYTNVTCDMEFVATREKDTYIIRVYADENGTISLNGENEAISPPASIEAKHGSSKRFNIAPNNGYKIKDVIVNGISKGPVSTYLFENIKEHHTIHVIFEEELEFILDGEWYYDNIELVPDNPEYVFRSRNTIDMHEDSSSTIEIETTTSVNVSFQYILNSRSDAMFGFTINGEPFRIKDSSDEWASFSRKVQPVDGKVIIGLTYSKGENLTGSEFLDLAAIKDLVVE